MKVRLLKKYIPLIICLFVLQTEFAFAQGVIQQFLSFTSPVAFFDSIAAMMANAAMTVAGYLLSAAGYLLDISIQLTLNIKIFVSATPAIYTVWKNLRDITGLFFIFYLLYVAIQMMTGIGKDSYGTTIKNIVIAGALINFSFFIVSVGIDASNITSQALYNAMRPNEVTVKLDKDTNLKTLVDQVGQSDISNIFMNSLRIQSIYDTKGNKLGTEIGNPVKTMLIGITGTIMMITTAASFILAALAFIARLVILLFLLAFSSIWFASWALPNLQKFSSQFQGAFVSQLIFMPIYLLLMYVSLSIINGSRLFEAAMTTGPISGVDGARWIMPYVLLLVNFVIVIFILNLPLFVGLSMGGYATSWLKGSMGKWNALKVWGNVGSSVGGWAKDNAWRGTGGRVASTLAKSEGLKNIAAKSKLGELALKGVRGAGGSYDKKLEAQVKARTDFASSLGMDERTVLEMKNKYEPLIKNALEQEKRARSIGDAAAADRYKKYAEGLQNELVNKKKERQANYASRIESRDIDTMFMKIARKDKVAAAKINIDVWQKQLDKKKEAVTKIKQDLDRVKTDIRRQKASSTGVVSKVNTDEEARLEKKLADATSNPSHGNEIDAMGTDDLQNLIDQAKLTK